MSGNDSIPAYTVRVSDRARHVRLTVTPREGLVVVVPRGARVDAEAVVRSKRAWAEKALAKVRDRHDELTAGSEALLPHVVEAAGIGLTVPVEYRSRDRAGVAAGLQGPILVVAGDVANADACLESLRRWLDREARTHLPPRVIDLARRNAVSPSRVRVGSARTRWGSCSARGTISLSRNSVFLPPHLLDALVLHELAHLKALDHSPRFWAVLREMDENAIHHRRLLRDAEVLVPAWAAV